jgi:antitoxin component YwqK of YwqJK toxin-antitoxin module
LEVLVYAQKDQSQNGYVKFFYPNGRISSEGTMENGKPDKFWKTYYVNGVIKSEGNRINFLLDSVWLFYNELGDTTEKISYVLGKKNGYYYTYSTVQEKNSTRRNVLVSKELYVNDKKEGVASYYYPDGSVSKIITYRNNKKHGTAKEFDKNGLLVTVLEYFNDYLIDKQNINRTVDGKKEGIWRSYYDNGKVKSENHYIDNQMDGYQKEFSPNGALILKQLYNEGKMLDLTKNDTLDLEEKIVYDDNKHIIKRGYYHDNIPVGIHREYNLDGSVKNALVYDEEGRILSQGIIKDDGTREGKWNYYYDNGEVKSEGNYTNNRQVGEWKFYYKGGTPEEIGNFNNGVLQGKWQYFFPEGKTLRVEEFQRGKREGQFIEYSLEGDTVTIGSYTEGEKNGPWKIKYGDVREEGSYVNDFKDGLWKSFYSNGSLLYQGKYIQGNPDGKHIYYYDNGKIQEEEYYVNGIKEKNWYKFTPEGQLFLTITYQNDEEVRINGFKVDKGKNKINRLSFITK